MGYVPTFCQVVQTICCYPLIKLLGGELHCESEVTEACLVGTHHELTGWLELCLKYYWPLSWKIGQCKLSLYKIKSRAKSYKSWATSKWKLKKILLPRVNSISWSTNVANCRDAPSHNPLSLCNKVLTDSFPTLPCKKYSSWFCLPTTAIFFPIIGKYRRFYDIPSRTSRMLPEGSCSSGQLPVQAGLEYTRSDPRYKRCNYFLTF